MHRSTVLLHTLPNGESHFDWLIDQPTISCEHRLLSWRCELNPSAIDHPAKAPLLHFTGEQLPDHRAIYLEYEGPISGNRGHVQRIAQGDVDTCSQSSKAIEMTIRWEDLLVRYTGERKPETPSQWEFRAWIVDSLLDG